MQWQFLNVGAKAARLAEAPDDTTLVVAAVRGKRVYVEAEQFGHVMRAA